MTDRPILFSGPMVRALLDGRKTQTRRLAWSKRKDPADSLLTVTVASAWQKAQPGDRLWVRESFAIEGCGRRVRTNQYGEEAFQLQQFGDRIQYIATEQAPTFHPDGTPYWWNSRPSIHMPRWASRLTLEVTETRMERLCDITEKDATAEGVVASPHDHRDAFAFLWNDLHGEGAFNSNPEVVPITFTVHPTNIDQMERSD